MGENSKKVFCAVSGGVDSAVAAALLKKQGLNVRGVFMKCWSAESAYTSLVTSKDKSARPEYLEEVVHRNLLEGGCPWRKDQADAKAVCDCLKIPFESWDFEKEYKEKVVDYMIGEYRAGRTPNPDVMCNREIKFGLFFRESIKEGADFVATGHYARLRREIRNSKFEIRNTKLLAGKDNNKDQSYFLYILSQEQLARSLFPMGGYTKEETRKMAKDFGLPNWSRPDSQGICFIGELDLREFLKVYIKEKPGKIVTTSGKVIGVHIGLPFYTIGQRQGIGIGGEMPFYVVGKDAAKNILYIAEGKDDPALYSKEMKVSSPHWISGEEPSFPLRCEVKIRYRQPSQKCRAFKDENSLLVKFDKEQRAITPGQSAVFYQGEEVLGGGIIEI